MTHYNIPWLLNKIKQGEPVDYLFFWGHTNKSNEPVGKFLLSQWYPSPFIIDALTYKTAEHWMMAEKARLFNDRDTFEQILQSDTPKEAKHLGRKVKGFVPEVWDEACFRIVVEGNRHKFSHPPLKQFLLATGEQVIVETSPVDLIWGIGLPQDSKHAQDPYNWRGQNLLGFALMEVRDLLRQDG